MTSKKDTLFAHPLEQPDDFIFDKNVVDVFPDMIKRSVPGYSTIIHMTGQLAQRYAQSNSHCYDFGCSLGASILAMRHRINNSNVEIIGIDNSQAMLESCKQVVDADSSDIPVRLMHIDLSDSNLIIENASVCVLNFTLQFVPLQNREALLKKIYDGMLPGGILIISEKIHFNDDELSSLMSDLHHYFKKTNGYSDLEISQKRNAIENVLLSETQEQHRQRLAQIGFKKVEQWFQCFNFCSLVAFK